METTQRWIDNITDWTGCNWTGESHISVERTRSWSQQFIDHGMMERGRKWSCCVCFINYLYLLTSVILLWLDLTWCIVHSGGQSTDPLSSDRQRQTYDVCLEVRGDYQNCSVLYCVLKLCKVISTLRWAVLTVLWIGFCHNGLISLCIDLFAFICVYFVFVFVLYCIVVVLLWVRWGRLGAMEA